MIRRDPGLALLVLALALAAALYAPTIPRGALAHDDTWLLRDNWILHEPSLHTIFLDTSRPVRAVLGAEYLPVRDLVAAGELAVFGDAWPAFHAFSIVLYLAAIALWFAALAALGIDRKLAGLAVLVWAVHPVHAESVAWLAEQKGLLALVFAGACALAYARYRRGGTARWLVLAALAAIAAVWSKAPAAFALAALGPLELLFPAARVSARRSLTGLAVIAGAAAVAFVPVIVVALKLSVVAAADHAPAPWISMVLGTHGFYVELAAMLVSNAATYPIAADGPSLVQIILGAAALVAAIAIAFAPRLRPELRAGCALWLLGWFPASRLVLPLRNVLVADRYLAFGTLGLALVIAAAASAIPSRRLRAALIAVVVVAAGARTFVAQAAWRDDVTLWAHAAAAYPKSGEAWARYSEALEATGDSASAAEVIDHGLARSTHPRLIVDQARELYGAGDVPDALELLREAAEAGEPTGMTDLALLLDRLRPGREALDWARRAVATGGEHAELEDNLCRIALHAHEPAEALAACERAHAMRPADFVIAFDLEVARDAVTRAR
jgi:hypothetical protein